MPSASQPFVGAVCLIPASGEYVYDTVAFEGGRSGAPPAPVNCWFAPGGSRTDMMYALDDLQASLPNCRAVALVVQWMGDSLDASRCRVYPSSTYIGGVLRPSAGAESWRVSDLTLSTPGLIPISRPDGAHAVYGGTPSDASVVRALREIRARGLKPSLYLQINMDAPGLPWRGLCGLADDRSAAASLAVQRFLGPAQVGDYTPDPAGLGVHYSGPALDFTFRRFVLHYAWLCTVAGGVSLFAAGSELRGLECIRGPAWTQSGQIVDAAATPPCAVWDYPFVAGLAALLEDCRGVFDSCGLPANVAGRENLVCYSADWSCWTGAQHDDVSGVFPHLDALWASPALDLVMIDNYMPLSDWAGEGGLDALNWRAAPPGTSAGSRPASSSEPASKSWPIEDPQALGFGLAGAPQLHDLDYLKSNIEGGERFDYFYADASSGLGFDPSGSAASVTRPNADRLAQRRSRYYAGQELFALKNLRWWWANSHRAVYDAGDGQGVAPHGAVSAWRPFSKSIGFMEYGFPSISRATNEENVFYDPRSVSGGSPFWCEWDFVEGDAPRPRADARLQYLAHRAFSEYWTSPANNAPSPSGPSMIAEDLMFAWCWDARPFPCFPMRLDVWSDGGDWRTGHWLCGKPPAFAPVSLGGLTNEERAMTVSPPRFPALPGQGWSVHKRPTFSTRIADHSSGREVRAPLFATPLWEFELTFDALAAGDEWPGVGARTLQTLAGFFLQCGGCFGCFLYVDPTDCAAQDQPLGVGDGATASFTLQRAIGPYVEPAHWASSIERVTLDAVPQASGWTLQTPDQLVFATPPAVGVAVAASFSFGYLCRFLSDQVDFENFMQGLWKVDSLAFRSVRL